MTATHTTREDTVMDWEKIVSKAKEGDALAWEELYNATQSAVYFTALKLTGNEDSAQDIAQEVYISAMKNISALVNPKAFPGWLKSIAVNLSKNYLTAKRPTLFGEDEQDTLLATLEETNEDFLPEAAADKAETCRLVDGIVDKLPEKQRVAVILYYYNEVSVSQIATMLNTTENTIKSRLNYARAFIKKEVEALEKKGTKLYCAGIPVLALLLRNAALEYVIPEKTAAVIKAGFSAAGVAATTAAATTTAATTTATATTAASTATAAATTATAVAAKGIASGVALKIIAGIVAVGVIAGGAVAITTLKDAEEYEGGIHVDFDEFEDENHVDVENIFTPDSDGKEENSGISKPSGEDESKDQSAASACVLDGYESADIRHISTFDWQNEILGKSYMHIFEEYGTTCAYKWTLGAHSYVLNYEYNGSTIGIYLDENFIAHKITGTIPVNGLYDLPEYMGVSPSYGYEYFMNSTPEITTFTPLDSYDCGSFTDTEYTYYVTIDAMSGEWYINHIMPGGAPADPIRSVLKKSPLYDPDSLYVHTFADVTHDGKEDMISVYAVSDSGCVVVTDASSGEPREIYRDEMKLNFNGEKVAGNAFDYLLYFEKGEAYLFKTGFMNVPLPEGDYYIFYLDSSGKIIERTNGLYGNKDKHSPSSWRYAQETEGEYRENAAELLTSVMGLSYFTNRISDQQIAELKNN